MSSLIKRGRRLTPLEREKLLAGLRRYIVAELPVKLFAADHDISTSFADRLVREMGFSLQYVSAEEWQSIRHQRKAAA